MMGMRAAGSLGLLRVAVAAVTTIAALLVSPATAPAAVVGSTIRVPEDHPTINQAVAAAGDGDVIQVGPGTYEEIVIVDGKDVTLVALDGYRQTGIEGGVIFRNGADGALRGFRVQFSYTGVKIEQSSPTIADNWIIQNSGGGGVVADGPGSPIIERNIIAGNYGCESGAGVGVTDASPIIRFNRIAGNRATLCPGGPGAGIYLVRTTDALVIGNEIDDNHSDGPGAGIYAVMNANSVIKRNEIRLNDSAGVAGQAAAVEIVNMRNDAGGAPRTVFAQNVVIDNLDLGLNLEVESSGGVAIVSNNILVGNAATSGISGIRAIVVGRAGDFTPTAKYRIVNNTVVENHGGASISSGGFDELSVIRNNILVPADGHVAVECAAGGKFRKPPKIGNNNMWAPEGFRSTGRCAGAADRRGNLSVDPMFVAEVAAFRLSAGSPLIDAGNNLAAPARDIAGVQRPQDGNGDGTAVVDIGAHEFAVASCNGLPATIVGTRNSDFIEGTDEVDVIVAFEGDDVIRSFGGDDVICAGPGDDLVDGGGGGDLIMGGPGNDGLNGQGGDDTLFGGSGIDAISGGWGADLVKGGGYEWDILTGGPGPDTILGGLGADQIEGGRGADLIIGGPQSDRIVGGPGADVVRGNSGDDEIRGGAGADWLLGDWGRDQLRGGSGADTLEGGPQFDTCRGGDDIDIDTAVSCEEVFGVP